MDDEEERSFRAFVAARSPALMRSATLLTGGDTHAAEDLLQTALAKTAGRWKRLESPEAYVRQVLYRQQVSLWRLLRSHRETTVADVAELPDTPAREDGTGAAELRILVRRALARLTIRQRAMLVLRYFEDCPEREVAELLGCSVGTVRSTTHRALARLRTLVPELDPAAACGLGVGNSSVEVRQ
ncbi:MULTISPECIES: SigE family RNA polymerase sigma factor [Streptomyces]|uniref:RNA polymerase sigma-E factor n=1 Tax=Streptomyces himastatinicus ATCC 53653 TaxID=457427 RepID=D9WVI5_9ACTN|nr:MULTISPECIES: SigE family RNA polymerase sigma factor [Streptomyces]EFL22362.1 RNA polymerase sigma-E factor [Streptomyces himastatinicus ATCC 53653]